MYEFLTQNAAEIIQAQSVTNCNTTNATRHFPSRRDDLSLNYSNDIVFPFGYNSVLQLRCKLKGF